MGARSADYDLIFMDCYSLIKWLKFNLQSQGFHLKLNLIHLSLKEPQDLSALRDMELEKVIVYTPEIFLSLLAFRSSSFKPAFPTGNSRWGGRGWGLSSHGDAAAVACRGAGDVPLERGPRLFPPIARPTELRWDPVLRYRQLGLPALWGVPEAKRSGWDYLRAQPDGRWSFLKGSFRRCTEFSGPSWT